ncbi:ATP-binding protein [Streptomyces sp. NPDC006997]|uniref:ATP-binding protein n=1 Tax=Streptomyces sp. NPDC006997 TaxID=3155356 RepID=UPI0033CEF343
MVIPLGPQAAEEHEPDGSAALGYRATWSPGAGRAADARRAVRALLGRASAVSGVPVNPLAELDAQLVANELLVNALRHTSGDCGLRLRLSEDGTELTIAVWDTSREPPRTQPPDPARVGGHGLRLVEMCSRELEVVPFEGGKQVVARLDLTAGDRATRR